MTFRNKKIYFISVALSCIIVFTLSSILLPYYINGDQYHYILWYKEIKRLDFPSSYAYYSEVLNKYEVVYFFYIKLTSYLLSKELSISLANTVLAFSFLRYSKSINLHPILAIFLVTTTYYFLILYLSAERLKFGFIFFFLYFSFLFESNKKNILLMALSIVGHLQMLIIYITMYLTSFIKKITSLKVSKLELIAITLIVVFFIFSWDFLIIKLNAYYNQGENDYGNIWKFFILWLLSIYCTRKINLNYLLITIILIIFDLIAGANRIFIFHFFIYLYYSSQRNKGLNIPTLLIVFYFTIQSMEFIDKTLQYGNGFYK
ncbi:MULTISPECIES: hypothetical protein [Xenorhabdus]|uniref:hypothetical protein n=1 Tax=Xenorhabdus TaxID=626 RepID=UPI00064ACE2A|nr:MULTISPECIES: hypothetical protein [Xenorhabdus]KLU15993.1 hypothetical protein AAY47_08115 [Xenorhabdus griffiniae]KOP33892.1 hypothetical protein AFK69_07190 [Xenorhabdus sp. GDc328]